MAEQNLQNDEIIIEQADGNGLDQFEPESFEAAEEGEQEPLAQEDELALTQSYPGHYRKHAFETPFRQKGLFDGVIDATVHEHVGFPPTTIIRSDQVWGVYVKWKTSGTLVRMICGKWCLQVHLESIGPGPELRLPRRPVHIPLTPCKRHKHPYTIYYKYHLDIAAGTITPAHCGIPYKLVTSLTYIDICGKPGPIAGFVEGPILQFIRA